MDNGKFNAYAQRLAKKIEREFRALGADVTVTWNNETKRFDINGPDAERVRENLQR